MELAQAAPLLVPSSRWGDCSAPSFLPECPLQVVLWGPQPVPPLISWCVCDTRVLPPGLPSYKCRSSDATATHTPEPGGWPGGRRAQEEGAGSTPGKGKPVSLARAQSLCSCPQEPTDNPRRPATLTGKCFLGPQHRTGWGGLMGTRRPMGGVTQGFSQLCGLEGCSSSG